MSELSIYYWNSMTTLKTLSKKFPRSRWNMLTSCFFFSSLRWTKQLTEVLLDWYTSIIEEEIYFNLMHWNNYSLLDKSELPKTKLDCKVTQIIIIKKHLSAVNNEKIHFLKRKISGIFIIRKCKYFDIILIYFTYE